ncbi:TetR/AcrR family transcriptional regulator [Citricoccus sp. GCM10030269]|uniref:TetR/AcrR family transcriptional regulator n=1 Tax=Citricoccus sp. GCM10030269 TaxID=3273388 RepID=UPI0036160D4F
MTTEVVVNADELRGPTEHRGRPRSEKSRVAVLQAAADHMVDFGFQDLTVEGLATSAGVSKQTIYRWWGSKTDVVVESMAEGYLVSPLGGPADTGDLRVDLERWIGELKAEIEQPESARLVQAILSALTSAGGTSSAIQASLIRPIMESLDERFRAHDRTHPGSLPAPPSFLAETVGASLLLHVMFSLPMSSEWIDQLMSLVTPSRDGDHSSRP